MAEGREVFADRYAESVGLAGGDQADGVFDHFRGEQVGGADFVVGAVGGRVPVGGQGGLAGDGQGGGEEQGLERLHESVLCN
ncbi:hypothetical protein D3C76_1732540 [compost metagenome]